MSAQIHGIERQGGEVVESEGAAEKIKPRFYRPHLYFELFTKISKTINSRDSLMVTHLTTNLPSLGLGSLSGRGTPFSKDCGRLQKMLEVL